MYSPYIAMGCTARAMYGLYSPCYLWASQPMLCMFGLRAQDASLAAVMGPTVAILGLNVACVHFSTVCDRFEDGAVINLIIINYNL